MYGRTSEYFPFTEFRDGQLDVLNRIDEAFAAGKNVLLSAATGFGKSPVNISICSCSEDAFYTTPLKFLQDQLDSDFSNYIEVIKGRDNYPCALDDKVTAANAPCRTKSNYKCLVREQGVLGPGCQYHNAKTAAQKAHIACANTSYMMMIPHETERGGFDPREVLIVDEAHNLDSWAVMYVSVTLYEKDVGAIPRFKKFSDYVNWVDGVVPTLLSRYKELQSQLDMTQAESRNRIVVGLREERDRIIRVIQKCNNLLDDFNTHEEEWVYDFDAGEYGNSIQFKPITSGRFLCEMMWNRADRIVLSSATVLYPELYLTDIGLDSKQTEVINVASTFPVKNRPFYVESCGKVNYLTSDYLMPVMADRIIEIKDAHPDTNGIVHCHSYKNANLIYDSLDGRTDNVILQDRNRRNESLLEWVEDDTPSLFISVNFTEGVDLKDDLCRYQISVKVPFLHMKDARVAARMKLKIWKCRHCGNEFRSQYMDCKKCGKSNATMLSNDGDIWYAMKTIETILQSYGRAVRSETDYADYYMLDGSFSFLYHKNKNSLFPADFKKAVIWM